MLQHVIDRWRTYSQASFALPLQHLFGAWIPRLSTIEEKPSDDEGFNTPGLMLFALPQLRQKRLLVSQRRICIPKGNRKIRLLRLQNEYYFT